MPPETHLKRRLLQRFGASWAHLPSQLQFRRHSSAGYTHPAACLPVFQPGMGAARDRGPAFQPMVLHKMAHGPASTVEFWDTLNAGQWSISRYTAAFSIASGKSSSSSWIHNGQASARKDCRWPQRRKAPGKKKERATNQASKPASQAAAKTNHTLFAVRLACLVHPKPPTITASPPPPQSAQVPPPPSS
ncbi:C6 zinc finger domain, partial [Cordyceps militaris]